MAVHDKAKQAIATHTFLLTKGITHLQSSLSYVKRLADKPNIKEGAKKVLDATIEDSEKALEHILSALTPEGRKIVEKELDQERADQMEVVCDMMLAMPTGICNQIEQYVSGLYNVYALNEEK